MPARFYKQKINSIDAADLKEKVQYLPCLTLSCDKSSMNDVIIMDISSEQTEIFCQHRKTKIMNMFVWFYLSESQDSLIW